MPVSVFAQSTNATTFLNDSCGLDIRKGINLGTINMGLISPEITTIIKTSGTVNSELSIRADDWREGETRSTVVLTVTNINTLNPDDQRIFFVNGIMYVGIDDITKLGEHNGFFTLDRSSDENTAASIAHAINGNNRIRHLADVPEQFIFAKAVGNQVFLTASVPGVSGNDVSTWVGISSSILFNFDSEFMYGGYAGTNPEHMLSSVTRYTITVDGSSSTGIPYSEKISFPSKGVSHVLTTNASPAKNINLSLQISGIDTLFDMPFSGPLFQDLTFTSSCN